MNKLLISKEVSLSVDVVTQTIAILAKRRAGKSYTMRKISEALLEAKQQIIIVDPKGDQWGIRSAKDGKAPGFPIVILGGEHGDVPLEKNSGEIVAKLAVEESVSILLDLSMFRKYEIAVFMTDFLENLYRLKAQEKYRTPVMLIIDEADAIAPQKPQKGEERMLGAAEDIVRRGGQRGIGCMLVTQRSAVLNKNVLTQAQMLVVLRTIAPQDLAAMNAWIDVHGEPEQRKILMESLPSLPIGDAWFWSPGWPTEAGIFKRGHVFPIETFDSGATPKPGEKRIIPKNLADVDLSALKKQMASTVEKMKLDDPKLLKKRIQDLEKELSIPKNRVVNEVVNTNTLEKAVKDALIVNDRKWQVVVENWQKMNAKMYMAMKTAWESIDKPEKPTIVPLRIITSKDAPKEFVLDHKLLQKGQVIIPANVDTSGTITGPEQRVLNAIAWCESIDMKTPPNELVAFLSGYAHPRSTGYTNPRGYLKSKELITYGDGTVSLTENGRQIAQTPSIPLTQIELQIRVLEMLPGPEKKLLKPLLDRYPESISNVELCQIAGYMHERSTGYTNPRGRLKSFGLIEYTNGEVKAKDLLFID